MKLSVENRVQLENQLIEKAMKDENFRKALQSDPVSVIEEELGIRLPEGFSINVLEETPEQFYLVLPAVNPPAGDELTEAELNQVAGGEYGGLWSPVTECYSYHWAC